MYTFLDARWGNEDQLSIVATTVEAGAVAISKPDNPELWDAVMSAGIEIGPPVLLEPPRKLSKEEILDQIEALRKQIVES